MGSDSRWRTTCDTIAALPAFADLQARAGQANPDIRAAEASVVEQGQELTVNRSALYPSLSFDYFYGLNANQLAVNHALGFRQLGSSAQAQLTIPVWNWGATRSKIRQSELRHAAGAGRAELHAPPAYRESPRVLCRGGPGVGAARHAPKSDDAGHRQPPAHASALPGGRSDRPEVVDAQTTLAEARNAYSATASSGSAWPSPISKPSRGRFSA